MSVRLRKWTGTDGKPREAWSVDVLFEHPDGRSERVRKASPVNTRRGAEQYERDLRQALLTGAYGKEVKQVPTVAEFEPRFLTHAETNNKPSTFKAKKDMMRVHIIPAFGTKRLDEIGPYEVEQFKAAKLKAGAKPKTVNNMLACLHKLLSLAEEWRELKQAPRVKLLRIPEQPFDFLDFDEAQRLIDAAEKNWRPMVVVALNTGLRLGELTALQWDCVDLVAGRLFVRRNLYRGQLGDPKGNRPREVPLNDRAIAALKGIRRPGVVWAFPNREGGALSAYNSPQYAIARACRTAGLRPVGWHTLRHTFASHLVMRGVPLKAVQELLGHATIDMTMRYAHLSPDVRRDAVKALETAAGTAQGRHMTPETTKPAEIPAG